MRPIFVSMAFIAVCFVFTLSYFILTPVQAMFFEIIDDIIEDMNFPSAGQSTYSFIVSIWGYLWKWIVVIFVIGFIAWLVLATVKKERESVIE